MYKTTSDRTTYLERVASHSTKEHATGRIDNIPSWAKEPEEYYLSLRERVDSLTIQRDKAVAKMTAINQRLLKMLPHDEYRLLINQRGVASDYAKHFDSELREFREMLRAAAANSWSLVFYHCARMLLTDDEFMTITKETDSVLGRRTYDNIRPTRQMRLAEKTAEEREQIRMKEREKRRLQRTATPEKRHIKTLKRKHTRDSSRAAPRYIKVDGKFHAVSKDGSA
jgi:hypothetical protein